VEPEFIAVGCRRLWNNVKPYETRGLP
jgi:hypothetical protein